jgi:methylmalonyl-CoA/ethylmalonyl-CoA epimerase
VLTKIHHVGVVVHSADETLKFYRDTIGLPVTADRVIEDQGVRGVLLQIGDSEIELLEPTRDDTGVARFLVARGEGAHHICFESDDVAAELSAAAAKGLELIDQAPRPGLAGMIGFLHPKACHGVLVEFATPVEPPHHASPLPGGVGATHVDHVVIGSSNAAATARLFSENFGIEIKRTMSRPGTGAHLAFAKLREVVLEFAGPGQPKEGEEVKARIAGSVLAVPDIEAALARVRAAGYEAEDAHDAVQPGARIAAVKTGTAGLPFALIQYGAG